ncbi:MAG: hypothetical protein R3F11_23630 [Verrucomicrobiales bacterium]
MTGLLADKDGAIYSDAKPELTRLIDEDSDRRADVYKTVSSDFGFSATTTNTPTVRCATARAISTARSTSGTAPGKAWAARS